MDMLFSRYAYLPTRKFVAANAKNHRAGGVVAQRTASDMVMHAPLVADRMFLLQSRFSDRMRGVVMSSGLIVCPTTKEGVSISLRGLSW